MSGDLRGVCENESMLESLSTWWRSLPHRDDNTRNTDDDTLDDSTNALLSMLPLASIVVDDADEVVRAHPSAYTLGVVRDDAIVEESVLRAVREVRREGGKKQFDLTTTTAHVAQSAPRAGKPTTREAARQALIGQRKDEPAALVSRPNWLKVIVGRLNEKFVVVLISDVSETIRFSQVRDSFITNVSEQLLKPTQSLERLADTLERDGANQDGVRENAAQLRRSCTHLEHMVSDLLLLIKAQEPILPTSDNRINVMAQLEAVAASHKEEAARRGITIDADSDRARQTCGERHHIFAGRSERQYDGQARRGRRAGGDPGARSRHRHRRQGAGARVRALLPWWQSERALARRHRSGPGHRQTYSADASRFGVGVEQPGAGEYVHLDAAIGAGSAERAELTGATRRACGNPSGRNAPIGA